MEAWLVDSKSVKVIHNEEEEEDGEGEGFDNEIISLPALLELIKQADDSEWENKPNSVLIQYMIHRKSKDSEEEMFSWMLPETKSVMKQHQRDAIDQIIHEYGGKALLALLPGRGKTFVACCLIQYYFHAAKESILILVPKSTRDAWKRELERWTGLTSEVVSGGKSMTTSSIVICTYSSFRLNDGLKKRRWGMMVFDESHTLKNPKSKISVEVNYCIQRSRPVSVLMISGTPRMNSNSELYNQLLPLIPSGLLGRSYKEFIQRYCSAKEKHFPNGFKSLEIGKDRYQSEMRCILDLCMVRGGGLLLEEEEKDNNMMDETVTLKRTAISFTLEDKVALKRLREIQQEIKGCSSKMESNPLIMEQWRLTGRAKFPFIRDWIIKWLKDHPPEEKLIIFVYSLGLLTDLQQALSLVTTCCTIHGDTSPENRQLYIDHLSRWNDLTYRVGILTYKTCAVGITLSPGCYHCVMAELIYESVLIEQAEKKLERIGQMRQVQSYIMIASNTPDVQILKSIQRKTNGNSQILDGVNKKLVFHYAGKQQQQQQQQLQLQQQNNKRVLEECDEHNTKRIRVNN